MTRVLALGSCESATEYLRANGFEVLRAAGKTRALGLVRELKPEVVLIAGIADLAEAERLVATVARDPSAARLPVLLLIPKRDSEWVRRGLDAGASDVFELEGDPGELLARVRSAARSRRQAEEVIAEKQRATLLELAGAVAHRINQPLTSMSVIVETLAAAQARGDLSAERLQARLGDLQGLVERMASIVRQVANISPT